MKEYQYSIIRRESRNPKRNREGRGISQSDLEALKQELEGNSQGIVSAIYDRDIALDSLVVTSTDISERLGAAEEALTGKLDSGDFSKWRTGELAKALASKQPAGSYVVPSQLATSQQQAVAEAVKRAGEMDKQIKVGGRNLIVKDRYDPEPAETTESYLYRVLILSRKHTFVSGDWYTLSMDVQVPEDAKGLDYYNIFDWNGKTNKYGWKGDTRIVIHNGRNHITFKWGETGNKLSNYGLLLYRGFGYNERPQDFPKYPITTSNITLVKGTIGLESYVPAPEDVEESVSKVSTSVIDLSSKLLDPKQGEISKLTTQLGSQAQALDLVAGSVERLSEQYSIEAHTIGSPILKSDTDKYVIQCRIIHTPTGTDYTDQLLLSARSITPEWYRTNPEGHDRMGYTDVEWRDKHKGDAEVTITRKDFVTSCTVGYKIPRDQIIKAIKSLTH